VELAFVSSLLMVSALFRFKEKEVICSTLTSKSGGAFLLTIFIKCLSFFKT